MEHPDGKKESFQVPDKQSALSESDEVLQAGVSATQKTTTYTMYCQDLKKKIRLIEGLSNIYVYKDINMELHVNFSSKILPKYSHFSFHA